MTLSKALAVVNERYVPGIVAYYGKLTPDPWQAAHDELEKIAGRFDDAIVSATCERFVVRCTELIERFKREGKVSNSVAPSDAFAMGENRVQEHLSRKRKECIHCGGKVGLKIVPVSEGSIDVKVICSQCAVTRG